MSTLSARAGREEGVTEIPGMVSFAQFADPQGNVVGLLKST